MTDNNTVFIMDPPRKRGRPKQSEKENTLSAMKPWVSLGMSRRTWFRRKAAERSRTEEWADVNRSSSAA